MIYTYILKLLNSLPLLALSAGLMFLLSRAFVDADDRRSNDPEAIKAAFCCKSYWHQAA